MADIADEFLADLDELDELEEAEQQNVEEKGRNEEPSRSAAESSLAASSTPATTAAQVEDLTAELARVAKLSQGEELGRHLERVKAIQAARREDMQVDDADEPRPLAENDREYDLLVECNRLMVEIDDEIIALHKFIRDLYHKKFPELESLVPSSMDYIRVVNRVGKAEDVTEVDLSGVLPMATIMVVSVTASTTTGVPLPDGVMDLVLEAASSALHLDEAKKTMVAFVGDRMSTIAPNLSEMVGAEVAAKLMGIAGGLRPLAEMPACNVMLLGKKGRTKDGLSTRGSLHHVGFIHQCSLIQECPPSLQQKACRLVASKATLLARVDAFKEDPSGTTGHKMHEECRKKIEKWQEPPPGRKHKALPVPDDKKSKKRGGRRYRKMKEKFAVTELRKQANRVKFGEDAEEETLYGEGLGMIGKDGTGKLRVAQAQDAKKSVKLAKKYKYLSAAPKSVSGLSSSLAFTPIQGLELENPNAKKESESGTASKYFSSESVFQSKRPRTGL